MHEHEHEHEPDFERLLHPVSPETFLAERWECRALHIARGEPDYYAPVVSVEAIDQIIAFHQLGYSQLKIANTGDASQSCKAFHVEADAISDVNRLYHSYSEGDTIALNFAHRYWEPAARLCRAFECFFGFPAQANVYFTPSNAQGFPPHFDAHDVFVLQIEGAKTWQLYDGEARLPSGGEDERPLPAAPPGEPRQSLRLNAGDLLYVPRGLVHAARTSECPSLHVTIGLRPHTFTDLIAELLTLQAEDDVELRRALPTGVDAEAAVARVRDRLPDLLGELTAGSRVESALARLRQRLIQRMRPLPDGHFRSLDRVGHLDTGTLLVRRAGMVCHVAVSDDVAEITFPGNRLSGPALIASALRFVARATGPFPVSALTDPLSPASAVVLARRAVREGLLAVVEPQSV